jgi:hypothetical protein
MKWSLSSLLRTLAWMAAGLSVLAIGLGRSAPRARPSYQAFAVRYHGVNMHCGVDQELQPCFLDRETGQIVRVGFPPQDAMDYAICSPWRDQRGEFQAVARWMRRGGSESDYLPQGFGVARFTVPEGRLIERVVLDHVPVGDPCWVPGGPPRIVFSAGDGTIYGYNFEESNRDPFEDTPDCGKTQPLEWRITPPGDGLLYIKDLVWPAEAKLGRRLIASLSYREDVNGKAEMSCPRLWWLELSEDATAIVGAGPLMGPDGDDDKGAAGGPEQRLPNIAATAEGDLALAYLSRQSSQTLWELCVASIMINPATGAPTVRHGSIQNVSGSFLPSAPAFSADGRWVYGIRNHDLGTSRLVVQRFPATDALAQADGAPRRPGVVRAEPVLLSSATVPPAAGGLPQPVSPRAEPAPLLGWANLGVFVPDWLVKMGMERHAGE